MSNVTVIDTKRGIAPRPGLPDAAVAAHLKELGLARAKWRAQGLSPREVSHKVREMIAQMEWL